MKRDFSQYMLDLDGKPFGDEATLRSVAFTALTVPLDGDQSIPLKKKLEQFTLLQKIHAGGVVDISADEIMILKERAAKCLSLIAVGRLCEMLEADPKLESVPMESA